jgi:hypothetical protein
MHCELFHSHNLLRQVTQIDIPIGGS